MTPWWQDLLKTVIPVVTGCACVLAGIYMGSRHR